MRRSILTQLNTYLREIPNRVLNVSPIGFLLPLHSLHTQATIEDAKASVLTLTSSIDELTTTISASETDLDKATSLRDKEHEVFVASEKELVDTSTGLEHLVYL